MFKIEKEKMKQIKASLVESIEAQATVFDTLNFTPYDDHEAEILGDNIFGDEDSYLVLNTISDGLEIIFFPNVHTSEGQGGLRVSNFYGFYLSKQEALDVVVKLELDQN